MCATKNVGKDIKYFDKRIKRKLPKISTLSKIKWNNLDLIFLSLPNGEAQKIVKNNFHKYKRLRFIDLSADFRLNDQNVFLKIIGLNIKRLN